MKTHHATKPEEQYAKSIINRAHRSCHLGKPAHIQPRGSQQEPCTITFARGAHDGDEEVLKQKSE